MAQYPLTVFHFSVSWGGENIGFSEVGGLTVEIDPIDYRDGLMSANTLALKRPGIRKSGNISLKRGICKDNIDLYNWFLNTGQPNIERRDLTITMLDEEGGPVFIWAIINAWPIKYDGPGLNATGNEIAIEGVELAHEGITQSTS
ncbi:phage tail protein [Cellulophaga baltica]|uniref:phage tail protein n=1 Tax=Cellulophaga baltica TaxID=76594 RepID=UPI0021472CF8|nr:phage tail protein [Cellulophaga baltica]MCR1024526.1 phage tail protein [Cellulophaga baltica]